MFEGLQPPEGSPDRLSGDVRSRLRILGWVLLGCVMGAILAALFVAYGQPELLLEQLNLRYCG